MQYDQQTAEWTSQLVEYQMEAADMLEAGKLRDQLLRAFGRFRTKSREGRPISPIDVMTRIKKIVVDKGDLKTPNNHYLVKTGRGSSPSVTEAGTSLRTCSLEQSSFQSQPPGGPASLTGPSQENTNLILRF